MVLTHSAQAHDTMTRFGTPTEQEAGATATAIRPKQLNNTYIATGADPKNNRMERTQMSRVDTHFFEQDRQFSDRFVGNVPNSMNFPTQFNQFNPNHHWFHLEIHIQTRTCRHFYA